MLVYYIWDLVQYLMTVHWALSYDELTKNYVIPPNSRADTTALLRHIFINIRIIQVVFSECHCFTLIRIETVARLHLLMKMPHEDFPGWWYRFRHV